MDAYKSNLHSSHDFYLKLRSKLSRGEGERKGREERRNYKAMESFSLAAQHGGAINHVHTIRLDPSTAAAVRELRILVTVVVAGWVAVQGLRAWRGSR